MKTIMRGIIPSLVAAIIAVALQAPAVTPTWWQYVIIVFAVDFLMTIQSFIREATR